MEDEELSTTSAEEQTELDQQQADGGGEPEDQQTEPEGQAPEQQEPEAAPAANPRLDAMLAQSNIFTDQERQMLEDRFITDPIGVQSYVTQRSIEHQRMIGDVQRDHLRQRLPEAAWNAYGPDVERHFNGFPAQAKSNPQAPAASLMYAAVERGIHSGDIFSEVEKALSLARGKKAAPADRGAQPPRQPLPPEQRMPGAGGSPPPQARRTNAAPAGALGGVKESLGLDDDDMKVLQRHMNMAGNGR